MRVYGSRAREAPAPASWVVDLSGAAIATGLLVLISSHLAPAGDGRELDGLGYALVLVGGAALGLSRRAPRLILGLVVVVLGVYVARRYPDGPVFAVGWWALFVMSWRTNRRWATIGAVALCGVLGAVTVAVDRVTWAVPLVFVAWAAVAALLGDALRNRRSALEELTERAHYLERTREEEARRRVAEDRLSIARDLHDSVADAMATISVQAGAAGHVVDRRPEAAKQALVAIQRASGDVLDELGAMLRLLRDGEDIDRRPTPDLDQLTELVDAHRAAQQAVSLHVDGPTEVVPKPIAMAAYRIVQESLTNVARHASDSHAAVTVHVSADRSLTIEVCNDGTGENGSAPGTGVGIRGMRERAEATGGRLEAQRRPQGGFIVRATWVGSP